MNARALLIAAVLAGCGAKTTASSSSAPRAAAKFPDGPPLVTPREVMSYRLALQGMDLATYDLAVGDITDLDGKRVIVVQGHAKTRGLASMLANVDDVFTSWIDVETGRSQRWTVEEAVADGNVRERTDAHLGQRAEDVVPVDVWINDKQLSEPQKVSLPDVWDYNAYLVALRAWEAPPGSTVTAEVFRSRFMWNVTITVHGEEKLVTELGEFPTLRFDAHAYMVERDGRRAAKHEERTFSIWITNDQDRVPVQTVGRTDYGDVKLSIVDYQPGTGERLRP